MIETTEVSPVDARFERRAADNEVFFQSLNADTGVVAVRPAAIAPAVVQVVCECALLECIDPVEVPGDVYELVRRQPERFVVLPEHVTGCAERPVEQHPAYWIMERRRPRQGASRRARGARATCPDPSATQVVADAARRQQLHAQEVALRLRERNLRAREERAAAAAAEYERALRSYQLLMRHRIANPLQVICGTARTLHELPSLDTEQARSLLTALMHECSQLQTMSLRADPITAVEHGVHGVPSGPDVASATPGAGAGQPGRSG